MESRGCSLCYNGTTLPQSYTADDQAPTFPHGIYLSGLCFFAARRKANVVKKLLLLLVLALPLVAGCGGTATPNASPTQASLPVSPQGGQQAVDELKQAIVDQGVPTVQDLKIKPLMEVKLLYDRSLFEVNPQTPERQGVGPEIPASWRWAVRPLRAEPDREQDLQLAVTALALTDNGAIIPSNLPTKTIKITVIVTPRSMLWVFATSYGWIVIAGLLPVLLFLLWRAGYLPRPRLRGTLARTDAAGPARFLAVSAVLAPGAEEREQLVRLREILISRFNESELRDLCFVLDVDYDALGGDDKADKARELVLYLARLDRVPELAATIRRQRPNVLL